MWQSSAPAAALLGAPQEQCQATPLARVSSAEPFGSAPLVGQWLEACASTCSRYTAMVYVRALHTYLDFLGYQGLIPEAVTVADIQAFVATWREHHALPDAATAGGAASQALKQVSTTDVPRGAAALRVTLTALRSYYDLLTRERICAANPLRGPGVSLRALAMGRPRRTHRSAAAATPEVRGSLWIPSRDDTSALAAALGRASARDRLIVALLVETALSIWELCALQLAASSRRSACSIRRCTHKGRHAHCVHCMHLSPLVASLLARYLQERPIATTTALLLSASDRNWGAAITPSAVQKALRRIAREAGVRAFTATALRRLHRFSDPDLARSAATRTYIETPQRDHNGCDERRMGHDEGPSDQLLRAVFPEEDPPVWPAIACM